MSTYCSDPDLGLFHGEYQLDVAYDCFGRDVRLLTARDSHYFPPDVARRLGVAPAAAAEHRVASSPIRR